ncbi:MAG: N-acetylmuramic acid 6-phosphate etherase [Tannerellaceae bacterium]|jgi:N-acetylmuramic acid 6-phosphate etherase|nr:N-acetylmuramic acid 6-phosphate etherase [Tannerellaceae bacterium]
MKRKVTISLDIGGTWIKGAVIDCGILDKILESNSFTYFKTEAVGKAGSNLSQDAPVAVFIEALKELFSGILTTDMDICGVGISTAGVVNYEGSGIIFTAPHLSPLKDNSWIHWISEYLNTEVILVNDADAVAIGAASLGYLKGYKTVGIMPVGTGLGFTVWRNGRRWNPFFSYTLMGCISVPMGTYDQLASAVSFAKRHPEGDMHALFKDEKYAETTDLYLNNLVHVIQSSYYIYHTEEILLGGGLADAATAAGFPLAERLNVLLDKQPLLDGKKQRVRLLQEGNTLPLLGAALVGYGEAGVRGKKRRKNYDSFSTERAYDSSLNLGKMDSSKLIELFWKTEQEAGAALHHSIKDISDTADRIVSSLQTGGRLIYVGAGTSGRLAAIDTVELACTFGFPRDGVITLIAGGLADAAFDIEMNFEEDASAVPEMLIASVNKRDIVVGISVSGSAYYVQSALAYAKFIGAGSILIQEEADDGNNSFCDKVISLHTGGEVISGSTRMKAGTATKKVLNFLSTTTMIRLEKVHGIFMTNMECINEKLLLRAQHILMSLYNLPEKEALALLESTGNSLNEAIKLTDNSGSLS